LFSQLYNSAITAMYQLNYDYYSTVLCENQDKPELHCDGQCYFSKQLKLTENTPKETEPPTLLPTLRLFSNALYEWPDRNHEIIERIEFSIFNMSLPRSPFADVLEHPPRI